MNKIIADCNKYCNGSKRDSEYPETTNIDFSHVVEFICNCFISFTSHTQCDRGAKLIQLQNCVFNSDASTTGYPHVKERIWVSASHYIQNLIQNGS